MAKDEIRLDWTTLSRRCLKSGRPSARMDWSSISPTVRKPNERRDRLFGLKLNCMLVNGGYFEHRMRC